MRKISSVNLSGGATRSGAGDLVSVCQKWGKKKKKTNFKPFLTAVRKARLVTDSSNTIKLHIYQSIINIIVECPV